MYGGGVIAGDGSLILNVDDDPAKRYSVTRILRQAGYVVEEAVNGAEALVAARNNPSLIMLDIRLPDMSGYEVCRILKSDSQTSSIPILHLSASFTDSEHKAYGLDSGADGYLTHPFDPGFLLATARSLLRLHKAENIARDNAVALDRAYREQKRIAETLQRSLLIEVPETAYAGLEVATFYEPAWDEASVGGDFYDLFALPNGQVALVVGDSTGKGLAAAARTAEAKFALRAYMYEHKDPAVCLGHLNRFLCDYNSSESTSSFVAIAVGLIDLGSDTVSFACAGCEPPFVLGSNGAVTVSSSRGLPAGAFYEADYQADVMPFQTGDIIAMTTDGITEARQESQFLTYDGLMKLAADHLSGLKSLKSKGQLMLDAARIFADGKFLDDICVILARHT